MTEGAPSLVADLRSSKHLFRTQKGTRLNSDSQSFWAHVASPALDKLLELLTEGFKVDSVQTDWTAEAGKKIITVYLRKGSLEANVKSGDRDFCDYASALYSSP